MYFNIQGVQVAALEVQNVKRAINRYGTLPKGARIGAYLESLRQSGGGGSGGVPREPPSPAGAAMPAHDEARSLSPRTARAQPHMIRSNSSSGVTATPASPRSVRAHAPLRSFAGSPAKPRPRLAELEFPPPPPDLPPPPEDTQPPPPPPPDRCRDAGTDTTEEPPPLLDDKPLKQVMKEMLELKLVAEIKERADKKNKLRDSPPAQHEPIEGPSMFGDPVTRLVSELSESLNLEGARGLRRAQDDALSPADLKAGLRKTGYTKLDTDSKTSTDFKAQLKKVDSNKFNSIKDEDVGRIIDFKSRLRKVDSGAPATNGTLKKELTSPEEKGTKKDNKSDDSDRKPQGSSIDANGDEEDKRRSTGSISSLKKLWENKESDERLSPKLKPRGEESAETSPEERAARRDERPAVPSKPVVKAKPVGMGGIYATPLAPLAPLAGDDAEDALAELRASLEWCTNEVSLHV